MKNNIHIRKYSEENHPKTVEWLNSPDIRKSFGITYEVTLTQHSKWVKENPHVEFLPLYVDDDYIGNIVLTLQPRHKAAYLQIYIGSPERRGQGLGKDFMSLALKHCFDELGLHRIWLHVREYNTAALSLYKGLGFVDEGIERESIYSEGRFLNQVRMSLLKDEFNRKET